MRHLGIWITVVALTVAAGTARAQVCSQQQVARTATWALDAQRSLNAVPTGDGMQTDVSADGRKAIAAMKDRLNEYAIATMQCVTSKVITSNLEKTLGRFADVKLPEDRLFVPGKHEDDLHYGDKVKFEVRALQPGLTGIVARFGIECGNDAMLMIFEHHGDAWTEVLRTQSGPYKTVAGGWEAFDYGVSPPDKAGNWFVGTKNMAPWCSSTWSEIRYAVLRPGEAAAHPRTLFSKSDSIWWGTDRYGDLKVDAKGFDLRWRAESMDGGVHNREWIAHYDVDGDRVVRAPPIAESPRDFADEWIRLDWKEAKHWTTVAFYGLKPLHDKLRKMHYFDYVAVRRCKDGISTEVEVEPGLAADDRHVFFNIGTYPILEMGDVSYAADPSCRGPNLYNPDHPN